MYKRFVKQVSREPVPPFMEGSAAARHVIWQERSTERIEEHTGDVQMIPKSPNCGASGTSEYPMF